MGRLQGKVALITGGARGMGKSHVRHFVAEGARVVFGDVRDDQGRYVADKLGEEHCRYVHLDVTSSDDWGAAVTTTEETFGRLDVLVNNASIRRQTKFAEMTPEEWREIMGTTIDGAFYCAHAAAPHIISAGGGTIINLGGISSHLGAMGRVHAITAKAGMVGLTRALSKELAPHNITVNTVVPGSIETVRGFAAGGNHGRASLPDSPLGRRGRPEEVAAMVRFLCSDEARYVTGQAIHVNGGAFVT
jgi:3alpha(or 20beta)-hydroxysteroid dehydrogenase